MHRYVHSSDAIYYIYLECRRNTNIYKYFDKLLWKALTVRDFISFYLIMKYYKHIFISQYFKFHRKEKELDSKVRKPAEAEKYRLEKIAEAEKMKIVLEAEALAEAKQVKVVYTLL